MRTGHGHAWLTGEVLTKTRWPAWLNLRLAWPAVGGGGGAAPSLRTKACLVSVQNRGQAWRLVSKAGAAASTATKKAKTQTSESAAHERARPRLGDVVEVKFARWHTGKVVKLLPVR